MQYEIRQRPNFSIARVQFDQPGEQLVVESSAMVAKDSALEMKTSMRGGMLGAAKRKLLGGESLFQNTFTATAPGQSIWVAPAARRSIRSTCSIPIPPCSSVPSPCNWKCRRAASPSSTDASW